MKKNYHYIISVMRISLISLTLLATFSFVGSSKEAKGQLLDKKIPGVSFKRAPMMDVIGQLEKEHGLKFAFDEQELKLTRQQSAALQFPKNVTLNEVFKQLFLAHQIAYREYQGIIYLSKAPPVQQPGKIYGKIIDDKGESLPGASVKIIELNRVISAAVDGSYSFSVPAGTYTMEVSYISYQSKKITDIIVKSAGLLQLNVTLNASSSVLKTVTIESSFKKEAVAGLYAQQKNAASITDGISAEQIARTPDNNMGQVMKRVSGVSTVDNRYVVVRGLTERYNQGMIDGVVLPSTDMNRRNFAFDVIPAEMVSSVVVNKTATPDVSSEFAGGQVSVNTLDIPLSNFTIISIGTGFNSNTLGKDFQEAGKRGKYDFLGFDDGHRKLPDGIKSWGSGPIPDYAVSQSKLFQPDVFKLYTSTGGLNRNFRASAGRVYDLKGDQKWGFVAGVSLRNTQETSNFINARGFFVTAPYVTPTSLPMSYIDSVNIRREGHIYKYNTTTGAQFNIGVQGKTYKIGFKNMLSQILNNTLNTSTGAEPDNGGGAPVIRTRRNVQDPTFIRILQNKLEGEHSLTGSGLKLTWLAARTFISQETGDRTKFSHKLTLSEGGIDYYQTPMIADPNISSPIYDYRIFTSTKETDYNWAVNLSQPFKFLGDKSLVKAGYNGIKKQRSLNATTLNIRTEDRAFDAFDKPYEDIMSPENMGIGLGQAYYSADGSNGLQFDGKSSFHAGYLMLDQRFLNKIRLVYGVRAEVYDMKNTQFQDVERKKSETGEKNTRYLPSANLTFNLTPKMNLRASFAKTVIRPDFRESSFFGYYDVDLDANIAGSNLQSTRINNTDLRYEWYPSAGEIISVSGFYKTFDKPIELVVGQDVSGYVSEYRYENQKNAVNYGLEVEIRKSLAFINTNGWLKHIILFGNATLIKSKVHTLSTGGVDHTTIIDNNESRPLYGQSPYTVNAGVIYDAADYGLTLNYNRSGYRTYTIARDPNITQYQNGNDLVDLQLFCRLLDRKMEVKLNVGNLLNSETIYYLNNNGYKQNPDASVPTYVPAFGKDDYEKKYDTIRYRIKNGVSSSFTVSYKF